MFLTFLKLLVLQNPHSSPPSENSKISSLEEFGYFLKEHNDAIAKSQAHFLQLFKRDLDTNKIPPSKEVCPESLVAKLEY